ncbi:MAG: NHLP family bacteriocin export ABC transporter peptidase/permease/ATPase subunit [Flavobacteriales bacterium]|nr:NHLP family bacteriocin export ABC transporter peptidase/permease/ATPase subunit [Flavobacteriales bacterium]
MAGKPTKEEKLLWNSSKAKARTNSVIQLEAVECGAASLKMVLAYFGRHQTLELLREDCGVNRDGSKAINVLKAARKHGLEGKGFKIESVNELLEMNFPLIIHWNFNHFLVLEGIKNGKFYLSDPAIGHRVLNFEEFNGSFTGIALEFSPGPNFEKTGKDGNLISGLKSRLKGYEKTILYLFLVGLFLVIPGLVIPVFSRIFVDEILIGKAEHWLWPLVGGMMLTAILRGVLQHLKLSVLLKAKNKLEVVTSAQYFWHLLKLPIQFFHQRDKGEIASRVGLNRGIAALITGQFAQNLLDLLVVLFYFILMLSYDVTLSIIALSFAALNIGSLKLIGRVRIEKYFALSVSRGKLYGTTLGGIKSIETLKAMGRENDFFVKWSGNFTKVFNQLVHLQLFESRFALLPRSLSILQSSVILTLGAWKIMSGEITVGMLVAFQSLVISFSAPISSLLNLGSTLQKMEGDMNRIDDVMQSDVDKQVGRAVKVTEENLEIVSTKLEGYVEFKNITFGYSKVAPPLIENFSLKINPGERIAFVGGSGSGKSTLAKLMIGFYEPWEGEILFDGKPRSEWPRQVMNNSLSMVSQEIFLYEGSVRDVVTLWDRSITDAQLISACKDSAIHDIINTKSGGYDYVISEGGKNFSGGQRQRVEIARSLVNDPSILILDEATSALDPTTELEIDTNIKKRKCTVVVVAHRLSTIRDSDEIIVLDQGHIIERGTHEDLVKLNGKYSHLIKM